jgi:hypothetical protein
MQRLIVLHIYIFSIISCLLHLKIHVFLFTSLVLYSKMFHFLNLDILSLFVTVLSSLLIVFTDQPVPSPFDVTFNLEHCQREKFASSAA